MSGRYSVPLNHTSNDFLFYFFMFFFIMSSKEKMSSLLRRLEGKIIADASTTSTAASVLFVF